MRNEKAHTKKAIIYARVSSDRQARDETIQTQLAICNRIVKRNNYQTLEILKDDGISGTLLESRELAQLLNRLQNGELKFDTLVVAANDRIFREDTKFEPTGDPARDTARKRHIEKSMSDVAKIKAAFITNGITITDNSGEKSPNDLAYLIENVIATHELNKIRERVDAGKIERLNAGKLFSSKPPYGYRPIRNDRGKQVGLEPDPTMQKHLVRVYEIIAKHGLNGSIPVIEAEGIPSPYVAANFNLKKVSGNWNRGTIALFIKKTENYKTGKFTYTYKGIEVSYQFESLISSDLYRAVSNAKWRRNKKVHPIRKKELT